ncbi:uncharacterized protein LOC135204184 [Macrobrachium nipponense]|uniref:uncharacterized protein LOC135204184 n=1 Tax=Macrobrachium nipponense TaxID=159736 RepID=UPI0030C84E4E
MGETLRAEEVIEMEKQMSNELQKSKLKNGEAPLLDPTTHRKLMRLFSRNTNVNLCLPVVKLHRLDTKDLKDCELLNKDCADYLCKELTRLKRNARKRAKRKFIRAAKEGKVFIKQECEKVQVPVFENLTNGIKDSSVAGPSRKSDVAVPSHSQDEGIGSPLKRPKSEGKIKKKLKKEKLPLGENSDPSPQGSSVLKEPHKLGSWEEKYLPSLLGPRAPLPPAPLLNLPKLEPPSPMGIPRPFLPFDGSLASGPPPLKPIHSAVRPNPPLGIIPGLPGPPPLLVGSKASVPLGGYHPPTQHAVSLPNNYAAQIRNTPSDILPPAPDLKMKSEKRTKPPPMITYPPLASKIPHSGIMDGWKPVTPLLGKTTQASSQKTSESLSNASYHLGSTSTQSCQLPVNQSVCTNSFSTTTGVSSSDKLSASQAPSTSDVSSNVKNLKPDGVINQPSVDLKDTWNSSTLKDRFMESIAHGPGVLPLMPQQEHMVQYTTVSKRPPVTSHTSSSVSSIPFKDNSPLVADSSPQDSLIPSSKTASSSPRIMVPEHSSVESRSKSSVVPTFPGTPLIVPSHSSVVKPVPSNSSTNNVEIPTSVSQVSSPFVPATSHQDFSVYSPQEVAKPENYGCQSLSTTKSQLYYLLLPSSMPTIVSTVPVPDCSRDNVVEKAQASSEPSLGDSVKKSPSFKKRSVGVVSSSILPRLDSGISRGDKQKFLKSSEPVETSDNAEKFDERSIPPASLHTLTSVIMTASSSSPLVTESEMPPVVNESQVSTPTKRNYRLLGFVTDEELEAFIAGWLKENYELCLGADVEQYKVQGHFNMYLRAKGRKHNQPPPILNCLKKVFGEAVTTRRHRAVEGQQRWHYCHIRLRENVKMPYVKPPKSRVRKRSRGNSTSAINEVPDRKVTEENEEFSQGLSGYDDSTVRVTSSLAVLAHLINTTKLPDGRLVLNNMFKESGSSVKVEAPVCNSESTNQQVETSTICDQVEKPSSSVELERPSSSTHVEMASSSTHAESPSSSSQDESPSSSAQVENPSDSAATEAPSASAHAEAEAGCTVVETPLSMVHEEASNSPQAEASSSLAQAEASSSSAQVEASSSSGEMPPIPDNSEAPLAELPASSGGPLVALSDSDHIIGQSEASNSESNTTSNHLTEWIQAKIASGKKVHVATLVVCLKKLRHCQVTNLFMKRHRINMRSGLRVRQSLRTWDIRSFLRSGGKKVFPIPTLRSKRLPKIGPVGSKSAAVQEMLLGARIGVDEAFIEESLPSSSSSIVRPRSKPYPVKKQQVSCEKAPPALESEKITPVITRKDKYLLMKNERLTVGQKRFAYWIGLDLAKRARKNRRLDRVEGSNRRLDLSFFGLKENPDPSSWTMIENVKGGKKGTTVIFQPPNETTIVSTSNSEIAARPVALPQGYPPSLPPLPPAPAVLPPVPQACASSATSKVITISSQGKVFATVPFPPVQTTIAPTTTVPTSMIPKVSSHEFNKPPTSSIPSGSEDNTAAGPSNRASPPPRLQFMGGNVPGFASTLREMAAHVRAQRSPMPPPLSFMGPSAMESQGRQSLHPGMSQANARQWPGNVDYSYHQAPPMRKYGVINHTRQVMPKQPLTVPINHTRQVMPKQPPTMPVHVMSHQTHQYASAPHPAHGAPVLERQLNQVHNVRSHVTDQRPSSLPHSAQGHVLLEQRPSSEPRSAEVNMSERVPSSSGQPHSTEGQLYKNTMHYSHGQYSGMSIRPGYNYTQHPGTDPKSGMRTTQAHGVAGQQLYNQPHHVQGHSYTHQQQSNIPHNVSGHNNLPGHMLTNQQVSSQTYARGYIYPNQQMHGLQSHTVINQQLRNHPQENQLYLMPRQQSVNQIPNMQGYNSSQMHYNTQGQVSNQQLSSSSYSIQNLMLPVQQHYRGPSIPQECPPTMQVPGGSHLQSVSNDNTTCSTQNIQRQAVDSQEAWNRPVQYVHPVSNDHLERTQVDQLDTPGYSSTAEASSNNHSSSVLHKPENSGATQYNVLQNTGEPSSYREARSVIMQASSQNDSSHSTGKVKFSSTNTFDERLGRVSQSQEDGCHIQREKLSSVEPNSRLEEEHQREREGVHVSETQTHNVKNVQNDWASSETQRESHDRGRGVLSQALMGTERNRDSVMVSESHSNESFAEDMHSTSVSKTFKTNASEKDSTFTTEQEQLPCDLDQINVSRFGLEENLNISSILQDTDKCSYQKDGLFDKLENNQAEVSKDRQNNPIPISQQSDGKDILQEPNTIQTTSEESAMDESDFGTLRGNLREHLAKIEPLLCRLLEIGLPSSSDNVKDTAVQLMEVEGYRNKWNWEDDLQKWYEEFSVSYGHLFHSKAKKQQLSSPAKNEVALWINKVKGEMLPFCSAHDGRIFYMQELNFFLDRQTRQIKYHKMFASSKICSNEKDTVSVLFTFNAEGQIGPGIIIFPRMVIPEKLFASLKNTSGGNEWVIGSSANGWLYSDCISEFVSDVFMPWLESHEVQKPVALFTSEYVSSVPLTEMCQNFVPHGLHLLLVPRAMSSVISPAEKIVVHYFISNWGKIVREWCTANLSQSLMEENFAPFIISTIRNRIFNGNVRKTFLELGMWPFEGRIVFEQFQDNSL